MCDPSHKSLCPFCKLLEKTFKIFTHVQMSKNSLEILTFQQFSYNRHQAALRKQYSIQVCLYNRNKINFVRIWKICWHEIFKSSIHETNEGLSLHFGPKQHWLYSANQYSEVCLKLHRTSAVKRNPIPEAIRTSPYIVSSQNKVDCDGWENLWNSNTKSFRFEKIFE